MEAASASGPVEDRRSLDASWEDDSTPVSETDVSLGDLRLSLSCDRRKSADARAAGDLGLMLPFGWTSADDRAEADLEPS